MSDLFQMIIRLDGESMNEFGGAVAKIGVEFPALMLTDAQELSALCKAEAIDLSVVATVTARMMQNAQAATQIGNAVVTIIGMCQPVRIDGGPVQ